MVKEPIVETIALKGSITTDLHGINSLFEFYNNAKKYNNQDIFLDFSGLNWFDANLCALFGCMVYKLRIENNIKFFGELDYLQNNFEVLFRNGFFGNLEDDRKSTISYRRFSPTDKENFLSYIQNDLLQHRAFPDAQKDDIIDNLIEIFCNIQTHSKTKEDFFVCGQYFPQKKYIVFTMVDIGLGFLPAINNKVKNITNHADAINWALKRSNTTKDFGGLGLSDLHNYFSRDNNGKMQIITGDTYWCSNQTFSQNNCFNLKNTFCGATINLFFNCN